MRRAHAGSGERNAVTFFERWKQRFTVCFTRNPKRFKKWELSPLQQEQQDAHLTNWLYWPKATTACSSEPPRYVPRLQGLKTRKTE